MYRTLNILQRRSEELSEAKKGLLDERELAILKVSLEAKERSILIAESILATFGAAQVELRVLTNNLGPDFSLLAIIRGDSRRETARP